MEDGDGSIEGEAPKVKSRDGDVLWLRWEVRITYDDVLNPGCALSQSRYSFIQSQHSVLSRGRVVMEIGLNAR